MVPSAGQLRKEAFGALPLELPDSLYYVILILIFILATVAVQYSVQSTTCWPHGGGQLGQHILSSFKYHKKHCHCIPMHFFLEKVGKKRLVPIEGS